MTLPLEAKKWQLNERKCKKQEDDKMKKPLVLFKYINVLMTRKLAILICEINMQD
jgi:hypothetical protein